MTDNSKLAQTYNDVPYTSNVFSLAQPTRLHALAKIKGLQPADPSTAKVLEIGCSFGGNLLPFAILHPNSQLVGIDLSEHQINIGKRMMEMIGVKNIELVAADISQVSFNIKFDYIICHGVFSWVPDFVQTAILETIKNYLSPNGIAYISYNIYPGWKLKDIAKDLMQFGSNANLNKLDRVDQSFETLDFVSNIFERKNNTFQKEWINCFKEVMGSSKFYVAHEHFEEYNQPIYFKDFIQKINDLDLAYVTDSSVSSIVSFASVNNEEYEKICHFFNHNVESIEQFFDFINNRTFRTSIITHQSNLLQNGINNNIEQYHYCRHFNEIYLFAKPVYIEENGYALWRFSNGMSVSSTPLTDAIFNYLANKGEPCKIIEISDSLSDKEFFNKDDFERIIYRLIHSEENYISFSPYKISSYGKKPKVFEMYRKLIQVVTNNPDVTTLSNGYYQIIGLNFFTKYISQYLDGTRTIKNLIQQVRKDMESGAIRVTHSDGRQLDNNDLKDEEIKEMIIQALDSLQANGYFNHYSAEL